MGILKEFREFAIKGNFIDLAVGVVLATASGKVVSALVEKVILPPIGLATGRVNFHELRFVLEPQRLGPDGKEIAKEVAIGYGSTIQAFIELFAIAFVVFAIVRIYNRMRTVAAPAEPTGQEKLLMEIRDLLKPETKNKP